MTRTVYLTGYQGTNLDALETLLDSLHADLFDIRFKPWSPNPQYTKRDFQDRFGARYHHVVDLGNRLYKTEQVELVDFDAGLQRIQTNTRSVVLMCACADPTTRHRTVVGRLLAERGFAVTELRAGPKAEPIHPSPSTHTQERLL